MFRDGSGSAGLALSCCRVAFGHVKNDDSSRHAVLSVVHTLDYYYCCVGCSISPLAEPASKLIQTLEYLVDTDESGRDPHVFLNEHYLKFEIPGRFHSIFQNINPEPRV